MTVALTAVAATLSIHDLTHPLGVASGSVILDEGWSPYAQADLTVTMPADQPVFDGLDPRDNPRVSVTAIRSVPAFGLSQTRTFDLVITARTLDHAEATVSLQAASDESLLQSYALVSTEPDTSALTHQSSVRDIVNDVVLAKIGAALEPGDADADFTTFTAVTNLLLNPTAATSAANWTAAGNCTVSHDPSHILYTPGSVKMTIIAAGAAALVADTNPASLSATPGSDYTFSAYVASSQAATARLSLRFFDAAGAAIGQDAIGESATTSPAGYTRLFVTATAPAAAVKLWPIASIIAGGLAGANHYWDGAMLTADSGLDTGGEPYAYFDGSTPDTAAYTYEWTGTANASTSTRSPVVERSPQTLSWEPGQSAEAFLAPVLDQAQLRLFCDEQRAWRLVDSTYAIDGRVMIAAGYNAYGATDTISRTQTADDGTPLWFDAVVLKYTWIDTDGVQQTRYDTASVASPTQVYRRDLERPYPGQGAANYILSRVAGQGRVLDLRAAFDLNATPGMEAVATLPLTPIQTGYVSRVQWDFGDDEMRVGTRGLIDTPPSAWLRLEPGETWTDSPIGASWLAEAI